MIDHDQAWEIAREWARQYRGELQLHLHEFDLGWVVTAAGPPMTVVDGVPRPPASTGGPSAVIDRENGKVTNFGSAPWQTTAKEYPHYRAAEGRFPPDVRQVLEKAGWQPGYDVSAWIDRWLARYADELSGLECSPAARAALNEFGGLQLPQFGSRGKPNGGFWSYLYPTQVPGLPVDSAEYFTEEYGIPVFPLGNNEDESSDLVIDAQGRVFKVHWAGDFYVGADIDSAIINLIRWVKYPEFWDRESLENLEPPVSR